jgi:hypothetical protein
MTMVQNQPTEQQNRWIQGWKLSVVLGFVVTLIRFKAIIPLVWDILVRDGTTHTVSTTVGNVLPLLAVVGGGVLCIYAVRTGYQRITQALEVNDGMGKSQTDSAVVLRSIVQTSLLVNVPVLYWAGFLFILLPQLVKIPNASLGIGSTTALAAACMAMVVIAVLATHIGMVLTRFSFRSVTKPLVPPAAAVLASGGYAPPQQGGYPMQPGDMGMSGMSSSQQNGYGPQPGGYYPPAAMTPDVRAMPSQGTGYAPQQQQGVYMQQGQNQNTYTQQAGYPTPGTTQAGGTPPRTQTDGVQGGLGEKQQGTGDRRGIGGAPGAGVGNRFPWG